jgi:hypothetical protein
MNRVVRGVLVPLSMVAVLAGCAMDPTSPTSTSSHTVSTTAKLRPVTIPYRDGLVYTFEETSAQALCHALSPQEWHSLLGTEAVRTIEIDHGFSCVVASGSLTISMSMVSTEPFAPSRDRETERIGGYPAWTEPGEAVIDLVDGPHTTWAKPYLHMSVATEPGDNDQRDLLRRLATTLLTRLTHDGPTTPVNNADGALTFAPTQPVPDVRLSDLPRPILALVLCTAMTQTGAPNVTYVNMAGQCTADDSDRSDRRASVAVEDNDGGPARFTIGGHPARFTNRGAIMITLAELPWNGPEHLYVQLTVEWLSADQTTAKAWADQFVTQLGEL